jgi:hypothetical protein
MPIYQQQNEVQTIIVKDIKREISEVAKNGIYRNCLVCGDNNYKCGSFIITSKNKIHIFSGSFSGKHTGTGLQLCNGCQVRKIIN